MSVLSRVRRRDVIWFVVLVVVAGALWVSDDRAEAGAPPPDGIDVVFVAVSTNFPDALGVGPAAAALNAPIILVPTNPPLPAVTEAELLRLNPKEVAIVGGEAVVSEAMFDAISDLLPGATVDRFAGADRYATNVAVSEGIYPLEGWATIPAAGFQGSGGTDNVAIQPSYAANYTNGTLFAPIQLPHDARIESILVEVFDADGGGEVQASVLCHQSSGSTVSLGSVASGGPFNGGNAVLEDDTIVDAVVDNQNCSYLVHVEGTGSLGAIRNVRIKYRLGATP